MKATVVLVLGGIRRMVTVSKTIDIEPGSELDRLMEEAGEGTLRLVRNGVCYRLEREDVDPWVGYDPEKADAGMRAAAGSLSVEDAERLKEYIYCGREEGTRPIDRP